METETLEEKRFLGCQSSRNGKSSLNVTVFPLFSEQSSSSQTLAKKTLAPKKLKASKTKHSRLIPGVRSLTMKLFLFHSSTTVARGTSQIIIGFLIAITFALWSPHSLNSIAWCQTRNHLTLDQRLKKKNTVSWWIMLCHHHVIKSVLEDSLSMDEIRHRVCHNAICLTIVYHIICVW